MAPKDILSKEVKISIINYLSGEWKECDTGILNAWLEEDEKNSHLFGQLVDLWEADKMVMREKNFDPEKAWAKLEPKMGKTDNKVSLFQLFARYAAVFILAFFLGSVTYLYIGTHLRPGVSPKLVEYTAPYGSKTNLKMADGTTVWLNVGTTLKYGQGFGTSDRNVELSGEAYFVVAKNKKLPFRVNTKNICITALGTKFNVKAYPEEKTVETILLEGSVKLNTDKVKKKPEIVLVPNQKAIFNLQENRFNTVEVSDASEISWTTDKWVIKNTKLGEFSKLLARRYNIDFTFSDERIKDYEFGGVIKDETIEQLLTAISYSAPVKYKIVNNHVTLSIDESKVDQYKTLLK
jgi:ferric-dicitrate binding protein FerR (iron transport regulator)